jgi:hypothetical protein
MTREEWFLAYAARSRLTLEELKARGISAEPCDCKGLGCQGWQAVSRPAMKAIVEAGRRAANAVG